jgi:hypothetical protein
LSFECETEYTEYLKETEKAFFIYRITQNRMTMKPNISFSWLLMNVGKSAACFCCQVAALVPDMFCNIYLVKKSQNC